MELKTFAREIKKSLFPLIIITLLSFTLNLYIVINLISKQTDFIYIIFPLASLIINFIFLIYQILVDFKMKYTRLILAIYLILILALPIAHFLLDMANGNYYVSNVLTIIYAAVALLTFVFTIISTRRSILASRKKNFVFTIVLSSVFGLAIVVNAYYIFNYGIYGQGNDKNLIYKMNKDQTYTAQGLIDDNVDTITIPDTFNNIKVTKFNAELLNNSNVKILNLDRTDTNLEFTNLENLDSTKTLEVKASKDVLDIFKKSLYNLNTNESIVLANSFTPKNLDEDEVYVSFTYDKEALDYSGTEVLNTWYGQKGSLFDLEDFAKYEYINHSDINNIDDLLWNEANNNSYILNVEEKSFKVNENKSFHVNFEKIYKIKINNDNDNIFEVEDRYKKIGPSNNYFLAVKENIKEIFDKYPKRDGFDLNFYNGDNQISDLNSFINDYKDDEMIINPVWDMHKPNLSSTFSNNYNITYGEDLNLDLSTTIDSSLKVEYKICKDNSAKTVIYEDKPNEDRNIEIDIYNLIPNDSGNYILQLLSYTYDSDLIGTTEIKFSINVAKKELRFNWLAPEDNTYSATNKEIKVTFDDTQAVYGDTISYDAKSSYDSTSGKTFNYKNANDYSFTLSLNGELDNYYVINNNDKTFNYSIAKKTLEITWGSDSHVYDGQTYKPTSTLDGICTGEAGVKTLTITVDNNATTPKDVGSYVVRATISNDNYYIIPENSSLGYSITPKPIEISFDETEFLYDGLVHNPKASYNNSDIISGDSVSFSYTGIGTNAGSYTVTAKLSNSNYTISNNKSIDYTINKRPIIVYAKSVNKTYGEAYELEYTLSETLITGNNASGALTTSNAKNVGAYNIELGTLSFGNNYDISYVSNTLTINPLAITVTADDKTKTYGDQDATLTYKTDVSLAYNDKFSGALKRVDGEDVGEYDINIGTLSLSTNYDLTFNQGTYTINKKNVSVVWNTLNLTYDGNDHITEINPVYKDVNGNNVDLAIDIIEFENAGSYTVTASFKNDEKNYNLSSSLSKTYVINKATNVITTEYARSGFTYGDSPSTETIPVTRFGNPTYLTYKDQKFTTPVEIISKSDAGTYYVRVHVDGTSNYSELNKTYSFVISKKTLTVTWNELDITYDGLDHISEIKPYSNDVDGNIIEFKLDKTSGFTDAATYNISVVLDDEYKTNYQLLTSTTTKTYTIKKATNALIVDYEREDFTYGDTPSIATTPQALFGTVVVKYYIDDTLSTEISESMIKSTTDARTFYVTVNVAGTSNYTFISELRTFKIKKKVVSVTWDNPNIELYYTGSSLINKITAYYTDINGNSVRAFTRVVTNANNEEVQFIDAGTYTIKLLNSNQNYELQNNILDFEIKQTTLVFNMEFEVTNNKVGTFAYRDALIWIADSEKEVSHTLKFYSDAECTTEVSVENLTAGTYYAKVSVDSTSNYVGLTKVYTFELEANI